MAIPILLSALGVGALSTAAKIKDIGFNEKINRNLLAFNSDLENANADAIIKASKIRAEDVNKATNEAISSARASYGASNLVTTNGSPLLAQLRLREEGNKAAQNAILEGQYGAAQAYNKASAYRYEAVLNRLKSQNAKSNALLTGFAGGASDFLKLS